MTTEITLNGLTFNVSTVDELEADSEELAIYSHLHRNVFSLLPADIAKNCFVAGGAIRSLFLEQPINDYDLFFHRYDSRSDAINFFETLPGVVIGPKTKNAANFCFKGREYDLCTTLGSPDSVLENFDFTINCFAVDMNAFVELNVARSHLFNKELVFVNAHKTQNVQITNAFNFLARVNKFYKEGFTLNKSEMDRLTKLLLDEYKIYNPRFKEKDSSSK